MKSNSITATVKHRLRELETLPYRSGGKKIARSYIAKTRQSAVTFAINPEIGKPEHHEYRWVSYRQVLDLAPKRLHPVIQWAKRLIDN